MSLRLLVCLAILRISCECKNNPIEEYNDSVRGCKRDGKEVTKCIIKAFDTLRPHLVTGLKELQIDPLDPLVLSHKFTTHEANKEIGSYNLEVDNLTMTGLRNFELSAVEADPGKLLALEAYVPNIKTKLSFNVEGVLKNNTINSVGSILVDFDGVTFSGVWNNNKYNDTHGGHFQWQQKEFRSNINSFGVTLLELRHGNKDAVLKSVKLINQMTKNFIPEVLGIINYPIGYYVVSSLNKIYKQ